MTRVGCWGALIDSRVANVFAAKEDILVILHWDGNNLTVSFVLGPLVSDQ